MHGKGTFFDPRLDDADEVPDRRAGRDSATCATIPDLDHLQARRAALLSARASGADAAGRELRRTAAAARARRSSTARRSARRATCRRSSPSPAGTCTPPAEIGIDDFQAKRSPDERYRTAPLKGLWTHTKGGFYHDGRFATLRRCRRTLRRALRAGPERRRRRSDLVEYLKSL